MSNYIYPETDHIDYQSIFHNNKFDRSDKDILQAITVWEKASDAKYIDIKGYACIRLASIVDQNAFAKVEIANIDRLLNFGVSDLQTGYNNFDLKQIPIAYKAMQTGRWNGFISIETTNAYLNSTNYADDFFSRKWIVATEVQALIWYKEFLLDVVKNGISFREDKTRVPIPSDIKVMIEPKTKSDMHKAFVFSVRQFERKHLKTPNVNELWKFMRETDFSDLNVDTEKIDIQDKHRKKFEQRYNLRYPSAADNRPIKRTIEP